MKNKEKYKTPEEREKAFSRFCNSSDTCDLCMIYGFKVGGETVSMCYSRWLELEPKSSGELTMRLVHGLKKLNFDIDYLCMANIVSKKRRKQIKEIWAKQDEEESNEISND